MVQIIIASDDICLRQKLSYSLRTFIQLSTDSLCESSLDSFFENCKIYSTSNNTNYYLIDCTRQISFILSYCNKIRKVDQKGIIVFLINSSHQENMAILGGLAYVKFIYKTSTQFLEKISSFIHSNLELTNPGYDRENTIAFTQKENQQIILNDHIHIKQILNCEDMSVSLTIFKPKETEKKPVLSKASLPTALEEQKYTYEEVESRW